MGVSGNPIRVLTIDGGGIHGVIPATILAYVEKQSGAAVSKLFDLVVGTSTGGILVLGLTAPDGDGRPRYSAQDLDDLYRKNAGQIFAPWDPPGPVREAAESVAEHLARLRDLHRNPVQAEHSGEGKPLPWWRGLFRPKYGGAGVESFLKERLGDVPLSRPVKGTHVVVNSFDLDSYALAMLRSWEAESSRDFDFPMWAAARATSAAPTFFPPAAVQGLNPNVVLHGIDGAVAVNDPVLVGYVEARRLLEQRNEITAPVLVVSIGCGKPARRSIPYDKVEDAGLLQWSLNGLMDVLMEGANVAANEIAERLLPRDSFHRLQAPLSGPDFHVTSAIDDWSEGNIRNMQAAARHFIEERSAELDAVISELTGNSGKFA
jgi:predicted acylesterase/phospholipase RssA